MAPQGEIPPAANVLGTIGTICWCVQLCPQIWRNYRTKSTEGLPAMMMFSWCASGVPFGAYAIAQKFNIPLIVQPQCFCVLCGVTWGQCMYYGRKWSAWFTIFFLAVCFSAFAAIEAGLVYAIRPPYLRGQSAPVLVIGILAFIMLVSGYLPIPFELLKRRGRVAGIDFVFLTIDWFGAFFSLLSLVFQTEFDPLFGTMYALCCAIEIGMVVSHLVWRVRTRHIRGRAKAEGRTFDEFPEAIEWQSKGIDVEAKITTLFKKNKKNAVSGVGDAEIGALSENESVSPTKAAAPNTVPNGIV